MNSLQDEPPETVWAANRTPPSPTPMPGFMGGSATGGLGVRATTVPLQDLSADKLIHTAPRVSFRDVNVPSLGGIALIAKLGQGGMGAVYYGIHPRLQQEVAVKVLPFDLAEKNPDSIQRFFREAQLAARVKSPHLIGVLDVNQESGLFYIVMEFVDGTSAQGYLRHVLKNGAPGLPETVALDLCIACCAGLVAAHAKGVIHRDVKPDNIMIPRDEHTRKLQIQNAKLADLGLARSDTLEHATMTRPGACMGSPGYMSPEQANDAKLCGKPADVFSLGATLYALLSGHPPFTGSALLNILRDTIDKPHEPIRSVRPEVSLKTSALLDRCLAKDPAGRFESAVPLMSALKSCRAALNDTAKTVIAQPRPSEVKASPKPVAAPSAPVQTQPSPAAMTAALPAEYKGRRISLAGVAVILLTLAAIGGAFWYRHEAEKSAVNELIRVLVPQQHLQNPGVNMHSIRAPMPAYAPSTPAPISTQPKAIGEFEYLMAWIWLAQRQGEKDDATKAAIDEFFRLINLYDIHQATEEQVKTAGNDAIALRPTDLRLKENITTVIKGLKLKRP